MDFVKSGSEDLYAGSGYKGEMDFPVMQREKLLKRKRIASSVVKLNQMGFLYLEENGYQPTEQLKRVFRNYKFRSETESAEKKRKYADCVFIKKTGYLQQWSRCPFSRRSVGFLTYQSMHFWIIYVRFRRTAGG